MSSSSSSNKESVKYYLSRSFQKSNYRSWSIKNSIAGVASRQKYFPFLSKNAGKSESNNVDINNRASNTQFNSHCKLSNKVATNYLSKLAIVHASKLQLVKR